MLADYDAVLFDFDGTLAPNLDLPGMRRDVVAYTAACGVPPGLYDGQYIVEVIDVAADWLTRHRTPGAVTAETYYKQAHQLILDIELGQASETSPFPGVPGLLQQLGECGLRMGVVTRNCRAAVLNTFPDLLDHVDALHARDDIEHIKPDPRHLLQSLGTLGSEPERAVMVGDGALDMRTAKSIGMYCVGVLGGSSDEAALKTAGADVVLPDCLALIDASGNQ